MNKNIIILVILIIFIQTYSIFGDITKKDSNDNRDNNYSETIEIYRAAIVDQLSLTYPNQNFTQDSIDILEKAGYTVDYYWWDHATVKLYKNLPKYRYKIIIFRAHSVLSNDTISIFTSEPYTDDKYIYEQLRDYLSMVRAYDDIDTLYFGITSDFIRNSNGRFDNATIIMMGCDGLTNPKMAQAFIDKGAKVFIGWNDKISGHHSDLAMIHLLKYLFIEKLTLDESLNKTFKDIGPDFIHNKSILAYYPK